MSNCHTFLNWSMHSHRGRMGTSKDVVWVRELGLGLNRAFSKDKHVSDMGTYERMSGLHLSLGAKHGIYAKEGMKRNSGKFHIDVMIDTDTFDIDDVIVFDGDMWVV